MDGLVVVARERSSDRCPYCRGDLGEDAQACASCETVMHRACRAELGRCSTPGCAEAVKGGVAPLGRAVRVTDRRAGAGATLAGPAPAETRSVGGFAAIVAVVLMVLATLGGLAASRVEQGREQQARQAQAQSRLDRQVSRAFALRNDGQFREARMHLQRAVLPSLASLPYGRQQQLRELLRDCERLEVETHDWEVRLSTGRANGDSWMLSSLLSDVQREQGRVGIHVSPSPWLGRFRVRVEAALAAMGR